MKKKVLSAVMAAMMIASMAVPAFASDTSTQAGDPSKVTRIEFSKNSYEMKQDVEKDFAEEIRVYETDDKLILDNNQLVWELEGDSTAFSIEGSRVVAIEKSGTATLTVKDGETGKISAKVTLTAVPNPIKQYATSYKFGSTTNKIPVGDHAQDYTFRVYPIPAGSSWGVNENAVRSEIENRVNAVLGLGSGTPAANKSAAKAKTTVTFEDIAADQIIANDILKMTMGDFSASIAVTAGQKMGKEDLAKAFAKAFGKRKIDNLVFTAEVDKTTPAQVNLVAENEAPYRGTLLNSGSPVSMSYGKPDKNITAPAAPAVAFINGGREVNTYETGVYFKEIDADDNNAMVFQIDAEVLFDAVGAENAANAMLNYNDKNMISSFNGIDVNKNQDVQTNVTFTSQEYNNPKNVKAVTKFSFTEAKKYDTIGLPSSKTIRVGDKLNLGELLKLGASDANVNSKVSWTEESMDNSDISDYAIVEDGIVTGVAVGTNKIVATLENGSTATTIVKVVPYGQKIEDTDGSVSAKDVTVSVGSSQWIDLKNVDADSKVEWKADDASMVKVMVNDTNKGLKILGVKAGSTTVTILVDGVELAKISVSVKGANDSKPSKPGATDNAQTGDSIFSGLFSSLF